MYYLTNTPVTTLSNRITNVGFILRNLVHTYKLKKHLANKTDVQNLTTVRV